MRLRLTREADSTKFGVASTRISVEPPAMRFPPLAGFRFSGSCVLQNGCGHGASPNQATPRQSAAGICWIRIGGLCAALPLLSFYPSPHSFGESGASFLRSRHASGITARAAEGTPIGGVAKRSTARLRAVAGASTLLGWGHGRRQNDLRRLLAALRMSAALAADGVGIEARRAETPPPNGLHRGCRSF